MSFQSFAEFFLVIAFVIGSILSITTVTIEYGYDCFDSIKKCVCNGWGKDCNTLKSKECKGEVVDNKCKKN